MTQAKVDGCKDAQRNRASLGTYIFQCVCVCVYTIIRGIDLYAERIVIESKYNILWGKMNTTGWKELDKCEDPYNQNELNECHENFTSTIYADISGCYCFAM